MKSFPFLFLALALAGCRSVSPWGDLNEPAACRILDGPPVAVATEETLLPIVTDDTLDDRWAAMLLAQTIEEMCGRKPSVFVERLGQDLPVTNALFVGNVRANAYRACPLQRESAEAFRVIATEGSVHFVGKADFAVFDWCERVLGMRCYPLFGKSVCRVGDVVVPASDYSDRPVFDLRRLGDGAPSPWLRISRAGGTHRGCVSVHQPHLWVTNEVLRAERPGLFENGETPMLCYGRPENLAYYRRRIDRHIAGLEDSGGIVDTNRQVVTVCQWDAPIRCACRDCTSLYDAELGETGSASPVIWGRFLRGLSDWLKTAHPGYEISFLPYLNTCEVPRGDPWFEVCGLRFGNRGWREPLGNAEAQVCTMPGLALLKDSACRSREERILRDWRAATGRKVINWHYSCWPEEWTAAPYVFGRTIQTHYAGMTDVTGGSYVCGDAENPRLALSHYVWMRCLWNPGIDVEVLYDEFALRVFGAAAVPMRALIALQESCWERSWTDERCSHRNVFETSYRPEDVARMKALVREADRLAEASGDALSRLFVQGYAATFEEFVAESDALQARRGRLRVSPGESRDMVLARSVLHPVPWAPTTVKTSADGRELRFTVRCSDPAADRMDFSRAVNDYVWGNDAVIFAFDGEDGVRTPKVDLTGRIEEGWDGFSARVTHDASGWTVEARLRLDEADLARGYVLGNVTRWRVGDRRLPEVKRVAGSRFEHSRLNTCYTNLNADPAAFVEFHFR